MKRILFIALFITCLVAGCIRPGTETSTTTTFKDTTFKVKGDDVKASLTDSLLKVLLALKAAGNPAVIEYRNNPSSPTHMTISLDDKGRVQADCKTDDQLIQALIKEIRESKKTTVVEKEVPQWVYYVLVAGIIYLLFKLLRSKI